MNKFIWFSIILLFFSSCSEEPEKPEKWIDNLLLSDKEILMATSLNINALLLKSELAKSDQISNENKILIRAFNSSFKSTLLGFNVDIPQKFFIVNKKDQSDGAIFWAGEITNKFIFSQTVKNFFDVEDLSNTELNILYIKDYNLFVSFNEFNFVLGFSRDKKYVKSKLISYFKNENSPTDNAAFSRFLGNKDDIGFYFSNTRFKQIQSSLINSTIASRFNNFSLIDQIDQLGSDFFTSLNFLNGQVSINTATYNSNKHIYQNNGVSSVFKNFISINKELTCFGFANLDLNYQQPFLNYIKILDDDEDFVAFQLLSDKKLLSELSGEMSFAVSATSKNKFEDSISLDISEDFWEDDFDNSYSSSNLIPPFLLSYGVKNSLFLNTYLKEINENFEIGKSNAINDYFAHLDGNFLHISNDEKLLNNTINKTNYDYLNFNNQFFQNPIYAEIDLDLVLNFLKPYNIDQSLDKNIFKKVILTGKNNFFSILVDLNKENKNSLNSILEVILQNQLLASYL